MLPRLARALSIAASVLLVAVVAVFVLGASGVGSDRLRIEAEAAITALAGRDIDAAIGAPRLSVDGSRFLAVQVRNVQLREAATGADILDAGTITFGVRFVPLLSGDVRLGSAGIADATLSLTSFGRGNGSWVDRMRNSAGLIDPDLLGRELFAAVHRAFLALDQGATKKVELRNVTIQLPVGGPAKSMLIEYAVLERSGSGALTLEGEAELDGQNVTLKAEAERDASGRTISGFEAVASAPLGFSEGEADPAAASKGRSPSSFTGEVELSVSGAEGIGDAPDRLSLDAKLRRSELVFANGQRMAGEADLKAEVRPGEGKVEIRQARLSVGRSRFDFHGAVGPAARETKVAQYRFELVSDGSTVAQENSSEAALRILARVAGNFDPSAGQLNVDEVGVRTSAGEAIAKAVVTFMAGKTPGIDLAVNVSRLPVAHVKQLWPWFAAKNAYRWANANVFAGVVSDSTLALSLAPGRIGNGVDPTRSEVSGRFNLTGARFDVTGEIPPVRDAAGVVAFQGADVDISLSAGTLYLPSSRTVATTGGTFTIRNAHVQPVIGDLDIDIAGEADAVAELASAKPIDAMRHLDLQPDDLSGGVTGNVKARIPLQKNASIRNLGWEVALEYDDLSIARPIQGRRITDATGSITVVPDKAVIKADANLDGMKAELDLVEPLGDSKVERSRKIALLLDDKARRTLTPGLAPLLSGPVRVDLVAAEDGEQKIEADLTEARLDLPWAGWSKGAGIPGKASLTLAGGEGDTRLSDILISGGSFSISGDASLARGGLQSADFGSVRLNRGDDIAVTVKRSGKGYVVSVRGQSFDARSLVKQFLSDPGKATQTVEAVPVTVDADVERLVGFDGEILGNVKLAYSGTGATVGGLTVSAVTGSGGAVSVKNSVEGGRRTVRMQSADAGAILRFLDIYPHMEGGEIDLSLAAEGAGPLRGQIDARDFWLVNEPRLQSMVSTPAEGDSRSLNQAVRKDIDTSRVKFDRGFALIEKGSGYLHLDRGVLRGPLIGTTFQGALYDRDGNMSITGTFMPAYGLNSLFGKIPVLGLVLGNGRDRGLIGITYKVAGNAKSPQVQINPISAIAPGIFRSIFEFN